MSCQITRNSENKITKVLNKNGRESQLFSSIAKHPLIQDTEDALDTYKAIYTEKFSNIDENDIQLVHKIGEKTINNYKSALNEAVENQEISIGFQAQGKFTPILTITKNTDKSSVNGFVQAHILSGNVASEKVRVGDDYFLAGEGETDLRKISSLTVLTDSAVQNLGSDSIRVSGDTFTLNKTLGKVYVYNKKGVREAIDSAVLDAMTYEEIKKKYDNAEEIFAERMYKERVPVFRENKLPTNEPIKRTDSEIKIQLLNVLKNMGVSVIPISNYLEKANIKAGVNPNAVALADIAEQVVAISAGQETVENLREETVHFIVEAIPQEKLENILRNIPRTEEYKEFSQIYTAIYEKEYSAEEVDMAVKKEILGKVIMNALAQREAVSETKQNFFDSAIQLISEFFQNAVNYFKPQYISEINSLTDEIQEIIETGDVSSLELENFKDSIYRFYNATPTNSAEGKLFKSTNIVLQTLQQQEKSLRNTTIKSASNTAKLERVQAEIDDVIKINSVQGLAMVATSRIAEIKIAIKDSKEKGNKYLLSTEESIIFNSLTKDILPAVSQLKNIIAETREGRDWAEQQKALENIILEISDISAEESKIDNQNVERLIEELADTHGIKNTDAIKRWITTVEKDSGILIATFGSMVMARDSMLNLMAYVTKNMSNEGFSEFMDKSKTLQAIIAENGYTEADLAKFVDGGHILSPYNFTAFTEAMNKAFLDTYRKFSDTTSTDEELLALKRSKEVPALGDKQLEYERELRKAEDGLKERAYKDEYYTEYEARMEKANVGKATKDYLSGYFSGLADIKLKSIRTSTVDGQEQLITDQSLLSASDRERLKELQQDRRLVKSFYDQSGNLKQGIVIRKDSEGLNALNEKGKLIFDLGANPSSDAIVAYELNKLDELNPFTKTDAEIPQKFISELRRIDELNGREEAIDFLRMNSYIGFNTEYWAGLSSGKTITAKLREALKDNPKKSTEIIRILTNIEKNNSSIRNIIKLFGNKTSPIETDVDRMSFESKEKVKVLQEGLATLFEQAKEYTKDISDSDVEEGLNIVEESISSANESYRKTLSDLSIDFKEDDTPAQKQQKLQNQLKFAKEHMTNANSRATTLAEISILDFLEGHKKSVSKSVARELEKQQLSQDDLLDLDNYTKFMSQYAENRLLPYYRRFSPVSYTTFNEELETTDNLADFISDLSGYPSLQITPNPSFSEVENNDNLNPEYNRNFKGGYIQPNRKTFRNDKFFQLFGDENGSANPKLFKVYQAVMDYRTDSLEANSAGKGYNAYLLPQTRKGRVEKVSTFLKGNATQNTKNAIADIFTFTDDEMVRGDNSFGSSVKVIPKMYLAEIEPSDVSTELFYSLMMSGKESYSRKSKVKAYGNIMSVMNSMKGRDYSKTGKEAEATQTMKMVRAAVDYSVFGIKENSTAPVKTPFGTIDLAKTARNLLSYVKLKNLGFNVVIPFTSYATAKLNVWTEAQIGQYLNKRSYSLGRAEYGRKWKDGMQEMGKLNTTAEINVLGQHFRNFDLDESFKNSNYGVFSRVLDRTSMALHSMANYPIYGQNMYSMLYDFRVVGDRVMNFNQFKNIQKEVGLSKADIELEWNNIEENAIYKFIKVEGSKVEYTNEVNGKTLADYLGKSGEELKTEVEKINNTIINQMRVVNSFIDGSVSQEDRSVAQNDAYLSYLTTHKNWLTIATARRFKSRHFNFESGMEEEGSYQSAWNFLGGYIREYKDSGLKGLISNFKTAYEKADDTQRGNLIRVGKEMVILNTLVLAVMILKNFADDEDNEDLYPLQLASYLAMRVSSETTSGSLGIGANYTEAIKAPIVGFDTVTNLTNVFELFNSDEITRGKYKGMSERAKYIISTVPGFKQGLDLYNINQTRKTYENFNSGNLDFTLGNSALWSDSEEKEE